MHIEGANYMYVPVRHKDLDSEKIGAREGQRKYVQNEFFEYSYVKNNKVNTDNLANAHLTLQILMEITSKTQKYLYVQNTSEVV